ncbi:MAG: hypothetical protein M1827_000490 [Pycnora praestabilis]|nr:MAG: hypothetical protein M1827_000490 [Pycnora praestabilis]
MLLPSALPCDIRPPFTRARLSAQRLYSSPPPSDDETISSPNSGIYKSCRVLQSMLSSAATPSPKKLHVERLQHASGKGPTAAPAPAIKVTKSAARSLRGPNKRRRITSEELHAQQNGEETDILEYDARFSTPKQERPSLASLPFGLEQVDFIALKSVDAPATESKKDTAEQDEWSTEEDRVLVEMVLEKLKLTKTDWNECARRVGKDKGSVGKRWKALVGEGSVGLKGGKGKGRPRIDTSQR